jgi:hypothetical protein
MKFEPKEILLVPKEILSAPRHWLKIFNNNFKLNYRKMNEKN